MINPDPKSPGAEGNLPRRFVWLGLGVVILFFVTCAALTWRKWPDILGDFGVQLYIPWRILHGAVLYRDLFYFAGGPFSQYFNSLLFKIFGVSFSTLIAANLFLTATTIFVVYRYFLAAADVWTATIIGAGIIIVFAFAEFGPVGDFNYVVPYSHEVLHGLVLSILGIALLCKWVKNRKIAAIAGAGFCAGIVFLTKPDIFMAFAGTAIGAFILFSLKHGRKNLVKSLAAFVFVGIIPPLFFFLFFLKEESCRESLRSVVFGWMPLFQQAVIKNPFYQRSAGLDEPVANLREIIICFIAVALAVVIYALVLRWIKNVKWKSNASQYIVLLLLAVPLLAWAITFNWLDCGWPLPLLCLSACVLIVWNHKTLEQQEVFPLLWSLFGLMLLAKLGLFPRIWHYGFALAMPAFVSSVYLLFWLLPKLLETKYGISSLQFRIIVGLVLLIGFENLLDCSESFYKQKTQALGTGGDEILTYNLDNDNSQAIYGTLLWAEKYMPPGATMASVPQGILFNYLTGHVNPTPCLFWDPNCLAVFGRSNMTAAFEKNPPDYIFIIGRDFSEFGAGTFGSSPDFGMDVMQWIRMNYKTQLLFRESPKNGLSGIEILKRNPSTAVPVSSAAPPPATKL